MQYYSPLHKYMVNYNEPFSVASAKTSIEGIDKKTVLQKKLKSLRKEIRDLQNRLYADGRYAVLLLFQAMDACGKDSTIRSVMSGVDPAGYSVTSFKRPSKEELAHDFLWRTTEHLPKRGHIAIFNRSYYEEVLTVKVHPEYLTAQNLPSDINQDQLWDMRYESIRNHEKHLASNGTVVLKFWLNASKEEQRQRLIARLDRPHKNWKFTEGDLKTRQHWDNYMQAYEALLNATSTEYAPWYAIPANSKPYMQLTVATIIRDALRNVPTQYPVIGKEKLEELRGNLEIATD